jgi:hypothetical protein
MKFGKTLSSAFAVYDLIAVARALRPLRKTIFAADLLQARSHLWRY